MTESITSLADLATQANENHQLAESTAGRALEFARLSGDALIEAKSQVGHGKWMAWVQDNFTGKRQTAQNYMQLAANYQRVGNLDATSIREALRALAGEDEEEEPEEEIPAAFEEALADVQHGQITDAEELPEEPRAVAVEVVEDEEELPEAEPINPAVESTEKDSEKLSLLKSTWTKASKKDKAAFAAWINKNWEI